jgi:hypothetical protein
MTQAPTPTPTDLDRRIRRAGKIGRFLCSTFLIGGTLLALLLLATAATHPEALVKLNLDSKHGAQVAGFRQAPAKLLALLLEKPEELIQVAAAQQEANKYQDLVDHPEKRGGFVAVTGSYGVGTSVLYLVDTVNRQIAVYEARGGSTEQRRLVLVGARRIDLDLQLRGYNDRSEYDYRALEELFHKGDRKADKQPTPFAPKVREKK